MVWPIFEERQQALVIGESSSGMVRWGTRTPLGHPYIAVGESAEIQVSEADWHGVTLEIERDLYYPQRQLQQAIKAATSGHGLRLGMVEDRLEALESRISRQPISLPIQEAPGFRLVAPLSATLEPIEGGYLARIPELDLWSDGKTEGDALEGVKSNLAELARDLLDAPDESLGRIPRHWKQTLARLVVHS